MILSNLSYILATMVCLSKLNAHKIENNFTKTSLRSYAINPTLSSDLEIGESQYVYVTKTDDLLDIVDQLSVALKGLNVDLKKWLLWQIQPVGYIVKLPIIKGQEHHYQPILDRYGVSNIHVEKLIHGQKTTMAPIEFYDSAARKEALADTENSITHQITQTEQIPAVISLPQYIQQNIVSSHKPEANAVDQPTFISEEGSSAESEVSRIRHEKEFATEDDAVPESSSNLSDWFMLDLAYNKLRYSVADLYLMFPKLAQQLGYVNSSECIEFDQTNSARESKHFDVSPFEWIKTIQIVEHDLINANHLSSTNQAKSEDSNESDDDTIEDYINSEEQSYK